MTDRLRLTTFFDDLAAENRLLQERELADITRLQSNDQGTLDLLSHIERARPLKAEESEMRQLMQGELAHLQLRRDELETALAPPATPPATPPTPMAEEQPEAQPAAPSAAGIKRHVAHDSTQWQAICTQLDFCRVGPYIVGFDSFATLDQPVKSSPDVKAQGTPVYRQGDIFKVVQADAGSHVVAGTSLGSGHVKLLEGQGNVKVNGLPLARHDNYCLINCDANGNGGALGRILSIQEQITLNAAPPTREQLEQDLRNYNDLQKAANQKADKVEAELQLARQRLDDTSRFNPSDWSTRDALTGRIAGLEQDQQSLGQDLLYYRQQADKTVDQLYPGEPKISASPSRHESREFERLQTEQRRAANRIGIMAMGPVVGAFPALVDSTGGSPEAVESAAEIAMATMPMPGAKGAPGRVLGGRPRPPAGGRALPEGELAGAGRPSRAVPSEGIHIRPRLRTQEEVLGQSEGGPGRWEKSPKRTAGEEYQEQISGVERGTEYTVNGVRFDGYDASRKVLLDAKDWKGYPPSGTDFWKEGVLEEADSQFSAANGTPIEWHVSRQDSAKALEQLFRNEDISIKVIVIPGRY